MKENEIQSKDVLPANSNIEGYRVSLVFKDVELFHDDYKLIQIYLGIEGGSWRPSLQIRDSAGCISDSCLGEYRFEDLPFKLKGHASAFNKHLLFTVRTDYIQFSRVRLSNKYYLLFKDWK